MKSNFYTISVEEALSPFIAQVETLIDLKQLNSFRPLSQYSLYKACETVNFAVLKFISTAENVATNYQQIGNEMANACNWSKSLVSKILDCTMSSNYEGQPLYNSMGKIHNISESKNPFFNSLDNKAGLTQYSHATFVQFNEGLMRSIERILLIADWIMVLDIRRAIIKVIQSLNDMDNKGSDSFPAFMHMFSRFGTDMVELGELSGQRILDLKNTQLRCLVAFVRSMLERTTMMILAVWKVNFRHDNRNTRTLRALVFHHTNHLLDLLMGFLIVSHPLYNELSRDFKTESNNHDVEFLEKQSQILYNKIFSNNRQFIWEILYKLKEFVTLQDNEKNNDVDSETKINQALPLVSELLSCGQIFTQCSFICLTERQHVISLCRRLRVQLRSCLESSKEDNGSNTASQAKGFVEDLCDQIMKTLFNITVKYGDEILTTALQTTNELETSRAQITKNPTDVRKPPRSGMMVNESSEQPNNINHRLQSLDGNIEDSEQICAGSKSTSIDISVIKIKVLNVCELLAHVSMSKEISLVCGLTEEFIESLAHMINLSIQITNEVSTSKHARDSTDVLLDVWISTITDITNIKNDICDWRKHKYSQQHYPFSTTAAQSSEIMKNYKLLHAFNKVNMLNTNNSAFSAPASQLTNVIPQLTNSPKYNFSLESPLQPSSSSIHQTLSMNSLDKVKPTGNTLLNNSTESPNPWLTVPEIDRIISMKGRDVIDLASQITMFSHNEGPLKTSVELMNCVLQLVREMANFHSFVERNIINNQILVELDKLPTLISAICSTQNQCTNTRTEMFTKIDRIVDLVRQSVTLITTLMINWKGQITPNSSSIKFNDTFATHQYVNRYNILTPPTTCMRNRFNFEDIPDNKSCFSDTTNTSIFQNSRFCLTRSSSVGKKINGDHF